MDFNTENKKDKDLEFDLDFEVIPMSMRMNEMNTGGMPFYCGMMNPYYNMDGYIPEMFRSTYEMMQLPYERYEDMMDDDSWGMKMMDDENDDDDEYREYRDEHIDNKSDENYQGEVSRIVSKIEKYNHGVFEYMRTYGIPYEDAKKMIERNIELALIYCEE